MFHIGVTTSLNLNLNDNLSVRFYVYMVKDGKFGRSAKFGQRL